MSNNTPKSGAVVVPAESTAAIHAAATAASEALAAVIASAKGASDAAYVAAYGADVSGAAVRLAKRAADEVSGKSKSKGGARADVLAVVSIVTESGAVITPAVMVAAARTRLDANAADAKARRERKQSLADTVSDSAATLAQRTAALDVLAGMDAADDDAKRVALIGSVAAAITRAKDGGVPFDSLADALASAFGFEVDRTEDASVTFFAPGSMNVADVLNVA